MFKRKTCSRCGKKVSDSHDFCWSCGKDLKGGQSKPADWGMLGQNDFVPGENSFEGIRFPTGFNTILNGLIKNLANQFGEMEKDMVKKIQNEHKRNPKSNKTPKQNIRKNGISISISTLGNKPPEIKVQSFGNPKNMEISRQDNLEELENELMEAPQKTFSEKALKKFSSLPRKEPKTDIRRLSDKVVYEIKIPGVDSLENVSIIKLEDSIEIKAVAKEKSYFKIIPINLPLIDYRISKGKLVLELLAED